MPARLLLRKFQVPVLAGEVAETTEEARQVAEFLLEGGVRDFSRRAGEGGACGP